MCPIAITCPQKKKMQAWHQMNTNKHETDDYEPVVSHDIATDRS